MHPNVNSSTIHTSQDMGTSTEEMDKEDMVHIYKEILLGHKK